MSEQMQECEAKLEQPKGFLVVSKEQAGEQQQAQQEIAFESAQHMQIASTQQQLQVQNANFKKQPQEHTAQRTQNKTASTQLLQSVENTAVEKQQSLHQSSAEHVVIMQKTTADLLQQQQTTTMEIIQKQQQNMEIVQLQQEQIMKNMEIVQQQIQQNATNMDTMQQQRQNAHNNGNAIENTCDGQHVGKQQQQQNMNLSQQQIENAEFVHEQQQIVGNVEIVQQQQEQQQEQEQMVYQDQLSVENVGNIKSSPNSKQKMYSIEFKLAVLNWLKENDNNVSKTGKHFKIDRKRIRDWKAQEQLLVKCQNKSTRFRIKARKAKYPELEKKLLEWITQRIDGSQNSKDQNQDQNVNQNLNKKEFVDYQMLISEARKIGCELNLPSTFQYSMSWVNNFMKRNKLTTRKVKQDKQKQNQQKTLQKNENQIEKRLTIFPIRQNFEQQTVTLEAPQINQFQSVNYFTFQQNLGDNSIPLEQPQEQQIVPNIGYFTVQQDGTVLQNTHAMVQPNMVQQSGTFLQPSLGMVQQNMVQQYAMEIPPQSTAFYDANNQIEQGNGMVQQYGMIKVPHSTTVLHGTDQDGTVLQSSHGTVQQYTMQIPQSIVPQSTLDSPVPMDISPLQNFHQSIAYFPMQSIPMDQIPTENIITIQQNTQQINDDNSQKQNLEILQLQEGGEEVVLNESEIMQTKDSNSGVGVNKDFIAYGTSVVVSTVEQNQSVEQSEAQTDK
eukprot:TRINITY_DN18640_c0_g2_i3.p1 TRINITY_DN18640_c0_g2~~TRINITY_DN18640_c0_g2_i3.p1  ORF type:complete len:723 (+),score=98.45 TRINITY_DN18640_c0_g2_i3:158-2326(+)